MVSKNKNTSPPRNLENLKRLKTLILYDDSVEDFSKVDKVLKLLQDNNLIKNWNLDRTDTNTDREHKHYYFDSDLSDNGLNSIINKAIQGKDITKNLSALLAQKREIMSYSLKGTLDKSNTSVNLTEDSRIKLLTKTTDFRFIGQDKATGSTKVEEFGKIRGQKKTARPINLLNGENSNGLIGSYSFDFHLNKEISNDSKDEVLASAAKAFKTTFERYDGEFDTDITDFKCTVEDNQIKIKFNNIFDKKGGPEIYMLSVKNVERDMEEFLKQINMNTSLDLKFSYIKRASDIENIKEVKAPAPQKAPVETPTYKKSEELEKAEDRLDKIEPSFLNMMFKMPLAELGLMKEQFFDLMIHLEEVREVLGNELTNAKKEELQNKIEVVEQRETELKAKIIIAEMQEALTKANETLTTDLTKVNGELEVVKNDRENANIENERLREVITVNNNSIEELEDWKENSIINLDNAKTLLNTSETKLLETTNNLEDTSTNLTIAKSDIVNLEGHKKALNLELEDVKGTYKVALNKIKKFEVDEVGFKNQLSATKEYSQTVVSENSALKKQIKELEESLKIGGNDSQVPKGQTIADVEKKLSSKDKLSSRDRAKIQQAKRKQDKKNKNNKDNDNSNDDIDGLK